ncbi:flagellar biosynthesis protein FlhF [Herbaspirillum sp.]|jgi:flagellar biosynthesis protein FlhF|uniref:flagellar biosynthesis protein FlhF n=1 Tax=Herbaspirillum TaxID=963 RepID=UPI00258F7AC2|nr:flagellar biosynthesis protein FlhF [Herbaspirillum sp.]MCP3655044.1 flagellar biosynthesis protein FlhF [Herbaspirillum sp.]MCP3945777.1 flagellar biosynthesis protein FlhF [Herbaspirillum sp.]MCP4032093.1 flagellar biosynthesis protein FlhF [Herbaspirillum sp.]MCP4558476.1 flagellar biosynthesis protein FlhF [Herbaspirillum sp.]
MNVKKFIANSSREAWRQVREALGPDAVILSNRNIPDGVEILAMANEDMTTLVAPTGARDPNARPQAASLQQQSGAPNAQQAKRPALLSSPLAQQPARAARPEHAPLLDQPAHGRAPVRPVEAAPASDARVWRSRRAEQAAGGRPASAQQEQESGEHDQRPRSALPEFDGKDYDEILSEVMSEIRSMRGVLETQLAEISWGGTQKRDPLKGVVLKEMLAAGFSASLSRLITENLPANSKSQDIMFWVKSVLARNLNTLANENELLENGGVFALVGPTGVGKTTTTAKLAARCVMRHGSGKLALITTDGYRIGGYEQLRIYGKILGVMVHSVKDETDLRIALEELKGKHTVLIDTAGVGQRDQMVAEQDAMLAGAGVDIKRLLCLNATATGGTLNEVVHAYSSSGLAGCIITKLDEAATIGNVLDVVIRHKLNLHYVANGQRVPEDLHVANKLYLADRAFKQKRETAPFEFQEGELPGVIGPTAMSMNDRGLREVSFG